LEEAKWHLQPFIALAREPVMFSVLSLVQCGCVTLHPVGVLNHDGEEWDESYPRLVEGDRKNLVRVP